MVAPEPHESGKDRTVVVSSHLDEREDIIYAVTIKRVSHAPEGSKNDKRASRSHLLYETIQEQRVRGGTLRRLVEYLGPSDPLLLNAFLATYRAFTTPRELFKLLKERYEVPDLESQALAWVSQVTNTSHLTKASGREYLQDGTVLCAMMNALCGGIVHKVSKENTPEAWESNVCAFLEAATAYGIPEKLLFTPVCLLESTGNMNSVYQTIHSIATRAHEQGHTQYRIGAKDAKGEVAHILSVWITHYSYELGDARYKDCIYSIKEFAEQNKDKRESDRWEMNQIIEGCRALLKGDHKEKKLQLSTIARIRTAVEFRYSDFSPREFAEQLTMIEAEVMSNIKVYECLGCGWSKKDKHNRAPTIMASIEQFNQVAGFVSTSVLQQESIEDRVKQIAWFIEIGEECRNLQNFSSAKAIVSGLQITPIHRLKKTWAMLPSDKVEKFEKLALLLSEEDNMSRLREALKATKPPLIPYLGMYLADLTYVDAANPDTLKEGFINMDKQRKVYQIIQSIRLYQQDVRRFPFFTNYSFHHWLLHYQVWPDEQCYATSLKVEPKEGPSVVTAEEETAPPVEMLQRKVKVALWYGGESVIATVNAKTTASALVKQIAKERELTGKELRLVLLCSSAEAVLGDQRPLVELRDEFYFNDQKQRFSMLADFDEMLAMDPVSIVGDTFYLQEARGTICVFLRSDRSSPRHLNIDLDCTANDVIQMYLSKEVTRDGRDEDPMQYVLWLSRADDDHILKREEFVLKYTNLGNAYFYIMGKNDPPLSPSERGPVPSPILGWHPSPVVERHVRTETIPLQPPQSPPIATDFLSSGGPRKPAKFEQKSRRSMTAVLAQGRQSEKNQETATEQTPQSPTRMGRKAVSGSFVRPSQEMLEEGIASIAAPSHTSSNMELSTGTSESFLLSAERRSDLKDLKAMLKKPLNFIKNKKASTANASVTPAMSSSMEHLGHDEPSDSPRRMRRKISVPDIKSTISSFSMSPSSSPSTGRQKTPPTGSRGPLAFLQSALPNGLSVSWGDKDDRSPSHRDRSSTYGGGSPAPPVPARRTPPSNNTPAQTPPTSPSLLPPPANAANPQNQSNHSHGSPMTSFTTPVYSSPQLPGQTGSPLTTTNTNPASPSALGPPSKPPHLLALSQPTSLGTGGNFEKSNPATPSSPTTPTSPSVLRKPRLPSSPPTRHIAGSTTFPPSDGSRPAGISGISSPPIPVLRPRPVSPILERSGNFKDGGKGFVEESTSPPSSSPPPPPAAVGTRPFKLASSGAVLSQPPPLPPKPKDIRFVADPNWENL